MNRSNKFPSKIIEQALFCNYSISNNLLHFIIEFAGQLNFNYLAEAVRLSLEVEPIFGCRYVNNCLRSYWAPRNDLDGVLKLVITDDPIKAIDNFTTTQINPLDDFHLQIRIFRHLSDTMCIKISHLVSDATGAKEYLYLLSSIYKKISIGEEYVVKPSKYNDRSTLQLSRQFGLIDHLRIIRRAYRDQKINFSPKLKLPVSEGTKETQVAFAVRKTFYNKFEKIRTYSSINKLTINDILLASFCRSFAKLTNLSPESPVCIRIFADLRRHLTNSKKKIICNFSGTVYPCFQIDTKESFMGSVNKIHIKMSELKNDFLGLGDLVIMAIIFKPLPFFVSNKLFSVTKRKKIKNLSIPPILTNFGIIPTEQTDFGNIKVENIVLLPPAIFSPTLTMGFSVYRESLTLSSGFDKNKLSPALMTNFIDTMINEFP